ALQEEIGRGGRGRWAAASDRYGGCCQVRPVVGHWPGAVSVSWYSLPDTVITTNSSIRPAWFTPSTKPSGPSGGGGGPGTLARCDHRVQVLAPGAVCAVDHRWLPSAPTRASRPVASRATPKFWTTCSVADGFRGVHGVQESGSRACRCLRCRTSPPARVNSSSRPLALAVSAGSPAALPPGIPSGSQPVQSRPPAVVCQRYHRSPGSAVGSTEVSWVFLSATTSTRPSARDAAAAPSAGAGRRTPGE